MKTGTIHPAGGTRLPLPTCPPCTLPAQPLDSRLGCQVRCRGVAVLELKSPLFYFIMAPKPKSSDAGDSETPQGSPREPSVSEGGRVLRPVRENMLSRDLRREPVIALRETDKKDGPRAGVAGASDGVEGR